MVNSNLLIPNKIIRTKRKHLSLIIESNGDLIVRAPLKASNNYIFDFINSKQNWIIKKRIEQITNYNQICNNTHLQILGNTYSIEYYDNSVVSVINNTIYLPKINTKDKLIKYLKRYAKEIITKEVEEISKYFNFSYKRITINSAKTCWGSCSSDNNLHFTYKLIMCPMDVVDYIIIHELCHTKIKNHSKEFWRLVNSCYPDYKECEVWLKKNRAIMNLI